MLPFKEFCRMTMQVEGPEYRGKGGAGLLSFLNNKLIRYREVEDGPGLRGRLPDEKPWCVKTGKVQGCPFHCVERGSKPDVSVRRKL